MGPKIVPGGVARKSPARPVAKKTIQNVRRGMFYKG